MILDELRSLGSLDFRNPASWPVTAKIAGIVLACATIVAAGYVLLIQDQIERYQQEQTKEEGLRQTYLDKKALALNLTAYQQQMEEMQKTFGVLLRQLPNTTEVPNLLVDITQAGLGRGLDFVLFKPEKEKPVDFYAELPITIRVTGTYHELGLFVSDVAALPRIVTFGDIQISSDGKSNRLTISALAKTYRYLETEEIGALQAARAKPGAGAPAKAGGS